MPSLLRWLGPEFVRRRLPGGRGGRGVPAVAPGFELFLEAAQRADQRADVDLVGLDAEEPPHHDADPVAQALPVARLPHPLVRAHPLLPSLIPSPSLPTPASLPRRARRAGSCRRALLG